MNFKLSKKNYQKLRKIILKINKSNQSNKRYEHTLRVEEMAVRLAKKYEINEYRVSIAALLHDCAKDFNEKKKIKLINKYKIKINSLETENKDLLHAKIGAVIAKQEFDIKDADVINAIKYHTTGRPRMSKIEKIIYIADFTELGRKEITGLKNVRELSFIDLDQTMYNILGMTIKYINKRKKKLDEMTLKAYKYYKKKG